MELLSVKDMIGELRAGLGGARKPVAVVDSPRRGKLPGMAQKVITQLIDDIDGKELKESDGETITFALDGTTYEIDLGRKNADTFRGVFQEYIAAGRKTGKKSGSMSRKSQAGPAAAEIREWARSNGLEVPDRGRIPQEVRDAFDKRQI